MSKSTKGTRGGFHGISASRQREICSLGGKAAHAQGRAHEFTSEEARVAGRRGGEVVSRDRQHMAMIGRLGGRARGKARSLEAAQREQDQRKSA